MILPLASLALLATARAQTAPPLAYAVRIELKAGLYGGTPAQADALVRANAGGVGLCRVVVYATSTPPFGTPRRDPAAVRAAWAESPGLSFSPAAQSGYTPSFATVPGPNGLPTGSFPLAGGDVTLGCQTRVVADYQVTTCPSMDDARALVRAYYCLKDPPLSVLGRWEAAAKTGDWATRVVWTAWPPLPAEPYSLMR